MRIYPAPHYTMGGLWVDYELMTTVPGLYALGEANFSDHGANRLGASALMQGLADGYFVLPYTIGNYLAPLLNTKPVPTDHPAFQAVEAEVAARYDGYLAIQGTRSVDEFHRELGKIMWDYCGMERTAAGLEKALSEIPALYEEFRKDLRVLGDGHSLNQSLERAGRVDDFFQLAVLMCRDALERNESCGGHFRAEYQTEDGEAQRDDEHYAYVAAWEWDGDAATEQPARRTARLRERRTHPAELQVAMKSLKVTVKVWRQNGPADAGRFETHELAEVSDEASFLEMLDQLNEQLNDEGKEPITFDHDCREGICGTCSLMIDGQAHGPEGGTATCQLHMRKFTDGATITVEPLRAEAFPIVKDLMVDRSPFDRIIEAGGFITVPTGSAPDANIIPVPKPVADSAMDAAQCIGCGACVAACPNGGRQPVHVGQGGPPQPAAPGPVRALPAGRGHGRHHGAVLRIVHQPRRVRGGVPEDDLDRLHRAR